MIALLFAAQLFAGHVVTAPGTSPPQAFLRESPGPGGTVALDVWEVAGNRIVRSYDVDMTKIMHAIVVSDDLADFQHVHPVLLPNGHLALDLHLAKRGLYHVYFDGIPHGIGRVVFRFDIPDGSTAPAARRALHVAGNSVRAGPYTIALDTTSVPIGEISTIAVHISKDGKPAPDLHPYLGAMAHGVFIGSRDLAYMHAHGMSEQMFQMADSNDCGDSMMLSMPPLPANSTIESAFEFELLAPSAQNYDFWLQFVGGTTLYTVPFLVTTK